MTNATEHQKKDIKLLGRFSEVYCAGRHRGADTELVKLSADSGTWLLCKECAAFLEYAASKRLNCPLEADKPVCKNCHIHCYAPREREKVREIMAYAGRKLLLRGRLDYLWHYFF